MKEEFDFESIKNKAIEQLKSGKSLLGKDGAFAPLLESILNAALEGEMDALNIIHQHIDVFQLEQNETDIETRKIGIE